MKDILIRWANYRGTLKCCDCDHLVLQAQADGSAIILWLDAAEPWRFSSTLRHVWRYLGNEVIDGKLDMTAFCVDGPARYYACGVVLASEVFSAARKDGCLEEVAEALFMTALGGTR